MDNAELIAEMRDRHSRHLVYEGPYRLTRWQKVAEEFASVLKAFDDWRQRIYRFDNRYGASVVLYRPMHRQVMRWDLIPARFTGESPFEFNYQGGVVSDLSWRDVQQILDDIRKHRS